MVSYTDFSQEKADNINQDLLNYLAPNKLKNTIKITKDQDSLPTTRKIHNHKINLKTSKLSPTTLSSSQHEAQDEVAGLKACVRELIENLKHTSLETVRKSTCEIRELAKNKENRILIASYGAFDPLVKLLHSSDLPTQENAVTAILNLSINNTNKVNIMKTKPIGPLIHVLNTGSFEARDNSVATLCSLSEHDENRVKIGNTGAIGPLVDLLGNGSARGKKDSATALCNLSTCHENRIRIVKSGGVKHVIDLMDPGNGMVDRAVALLANLAKNSEGRKEIAEGGGISHLVEAIELGSPKIKECGVAALVHFCSESSVYFRMVLKEGAVPTLAILSRTGTPRAKEKAMIILGLLRNLRATHSA